MSIEGEASPVEGTVRLYGPGVGNIKFGASTDGRLLLLFDVSTKWLSFSPDEARSFAKKLLNGADFMESLA
jgi:hypothetical protein